MASGDQPTGLSPWWRHATILVMIAGFSDPVAHHRPHLHECAPDPRRASRTRPARPLFDRPAILRGQEVFLKYGLMEHGTLWVRRDYLGPDYSAEYLHRLAEICGDPRAGEGRAGPDKR